MKSGHISWFEIPVINMDRAITFYSKVLNVKIKKEKLFDTELGIFDKNVTGIGGVLIAKPNHEPGKGIALFFYTNDMTESLRLAELLGGKIIRPKDLIKRRTANGGIIIAETLMDNQLGYYAEVSDSEGNLIALYSNS